MGKALRESRRGGFPAHNLGEEAVRGHHLLRTSVGMPHTFAAIESLAKSGSVIGALDLLPVGRFRAFEQGAGQLVGGRCGRDRCGDCAVDPARRPVQ